MSKTMTVLEFMDFQNDVLNAAYSVALGYPIFSLNKKNVYLVEQIGSYENEEVQILTIQDSENKEEDELIFFIHSIYFPLKDEKYFVRFDGIYNSWSDTEWYDYYQCYPTEVTTIEYTKIEVKN